MNNCNAFPNDITLATYNIGGLIPNDLEVRVKAAIAAITAYNPEVICLQEVVDDQMQIINEVLAPMYHVIAAGGNILNPDYTVTLISKKIEFRSQQIRPFENTNEDKTVTIFEGDLQKLHLVIIHSHLEKEKAGEVFRVQQFRECLRIMEENIGPNTLVIFSGDLNLRQKEDNNTARLPQIQDAWIAAGCDDDKKYTFDMRLNRSLISDKTPPRFIQTRYDRVFFCGPYQKVDFHLIGKKIIQEIRFHPSYHFGIVCYFSQPHN